MDINKQLKSVVYVFCQTVLAGFSTSNLKQAPDYSGVGTELAHHWKHDWKLDLRLETKERKG
jgi:hypothetical protein